MSNYFIDLDLQVDSSIKDSFGDPLTERPRVDYGLTDRVGDFVRRDSECQRLIRLMVNDIDSMVEYSFRNHDIVRSCGVGWECRKRKQAENDGVPGYVYIVSATGTNFYKVGLTRDRDINKRLATLQTGSPHKLESVNVFECDNCGEVEKLAHRKLFKCRASGEWFECDYDRVFSAVSGASMSVCGYIKEV